MFNEIWDYLSTPAQPKAKKDGYLYHAIALSHRAKRCEKYWQSHLENCHQEIEKRIQKKQGHLAILGSGLMLETPIQILENYFSEMTLIDVVHTKQVRAQVALKKNIHLKELDVNAEIPQMNFDFVISANILSQLPLRVCEKMLKQNIPVEDVSEVAFKLQQKHLKDLKNLAPAGLLFSDYQVQLINADGKLDEENLTVDPRLKIQWEKRWNWDLAPAPEIDKKRSVQLLEGISSWDSN